MATAHSPKFGTWSIHTRSNNPSEKQEYGETSMPPPICLEFAIVSNGVMMSRSSVVTSANVALMW